MQEFLTTAAISKILAVSQETIRSQARQGLLPSYRIGRQLRFNPSEVESFLARAQSPPIENRLDGTLDVPSSQKRP